MSTVATMLTKLANMKGAKFARFTYTNEQGETARHILILGAKTTNAYEKDVATLEELRPTLSGVALIACDELLASLRESLAEGIGNNSAYVHGAHAADTYVHIDGMPNVIVHKETGVVYVNGFSQDKTVITEGAPRKAVKSSDKTIAKNKIRATLRIGKFRQFTLKNLSGVAMDGETLEFT